MVKKQIHLHPRFPLVILFSLSILIYLVFLIFEWLFFVSNPSCNIHPPTVSENFKAKLKKICDKDGKYKSLKNLLSKDFLKDSLLWKYVMRIPKGMPLYFSDGFID